MRFPSTENWTSWREVGGFFGSFSSFFRLGTGCLGTDNSGGKDDNDQIEKNGGKLEYKIRSIRFLQFS